MRKLLMLVVAAVALVLPLSALAVDTPPPPSSLAQQTCTQERTAMGAATFNATYGTNASRSNAYGMCVSKHAAGARQDLTTAASTCKAQQADSSFAASHDGKTFNQFYGSNGAKGKGADRNAYGNCVSAIAKQSASSQAKADATAAKTCKAARTADAAAFAAKYGSGRNAFGKCVAATSKEK